MRPLIPLILALFLGACGSFQPEPGLVDHALTGSVGVLQVEQRAAEFGEPGRTILGASFARYQGIEGDAVLSLLGSRSDAELGSCTTEALEDELWAPGADVELLDVGAIDVSVAGTQTQLRARTFPDLASVLAGVFYASDADLAAPRAEVDEYLFSAHGAFEVGAFEASVPAVEEPRGLRLSGADGTSAALLGTPAEITRHGALTLQWESGDPQDLIEIQLQSGSGVLSCLVQDIGSLDLSATDVSALSADSDARLTIRRIRVAPFEAPGIDQAFVRVAATRTLPLVIR